MKNESLFSALEIPHGVEGILDLSNVAPPVKQGQNRAL